MISSEELASTGSSPGVTFEVCKDAAESALSASDPVAGREAVHAVLG